MNTTEPKFIFKDNYFIETISLRVVSMEDGRKRYITVDRDEKYKPGVLAKIGPVPLDERHHEDELWKIEAVGPLYGVEEAEPGGSK